MSKPWDTRIASVLVAPLHRTAVHPNHLTACGLLIGLAGAALFAAGGEGRADLGALLVVVSMIVDHADGELARATGKTSEFGHAFDRVADLAVKLSTFLGMGFGLRGGPLGTWAPVLGAAAGVALVTIFNARSALARRVGAAEAFVQPRAGGFEIEDVLYLIAPITWCGGLPAFVVAAGIGAPLFAAYTLVRLRRAARVDGPAR